VNRQQDEELISEYRRMMYGDDAFDVDGNVGGLWEEAEVVEGVQR
jgi:hypothetical protein